MSDRTDRTDHLTPLSRAEAMHLQAIEGNALDQDDQAMFAMFEREGWSHEQCLAYLRKEASRLAASLPAK